MNQIKQIIASIILALVAITAFILLAPFIAFFIVFVLVFSFIVRRKVMKANPEFFRQYKFRNSRTWDQEKTEETKDNSKVKSNRIIDQ